MTRRDLLPARAATSALFFVNGFGIGTWAAQLPRFKTELALSDGQLSLGLLTFALGAVALMPVMGWAITHIGSKATTLAAAFAFTAALFLIGLSPTLTFFAAAALLAGACNGTMDIAMNTNATVVEKAWGSAIMSSFHAYFSLGGFAGAAASGLLIWLGFGIVATLLVSCLGMALVSAFAAFGMMAEKGHAPEGHGFALPRGPVVIVAVLAMFCFIVEGAMVDWTAIYLQTVGGATEERAVMGFAAFSIAMTICRFLGDAIVNRLGRGRTVQLGGVLAALGLLLTIVLPQPLPATIGFLLVGFGLANIVPILFSTAGQMKGVPPSMGVAMVATLGYGGYLGGPPLIGFGGDLFGLRTMFGVLILLSIVIITLSQRALRGPSVQFSST